MTAFEELGVIPELGEAVSDLGWELPTPIQCEAIPAILGGGDILIAAETGSGKTGAFCLPVAQIVWEKRKDALDPKKKNNKQAEMSFRLNIADRDHSLALTSGGLSCEARSQRDWYGARATAAVHSSGKYYYEATITRDGLCRVGWSTAAATFNIGTDKESFGFGGTGKKSHMKNFEDYGESFTNNDVLGCYLDVDTGEMWWSKNGKQFPVAYRVPKALLTEFKGLHPAVLVKNSALKLNFGDSPFAHPPGDGFVGVSKAPSANLRWKTQDSPKEVDMKAPLCLVMEPTRELMEQTHSNLQLFSKKLKDPAIRCLSVAKGLSTSEILSTLANGCDIVTGGPHRLVDFIEQGKLSLKELQFIVIDEADQFLADRGQGGGAEMIKRIFRHLPLVTSDGTVRQVIICSATLRNMDVSRFANDFMHFPQWIDLKGMDSVAETVHHVVCYVDPAIDKMWIRRRHEKNSLEDDHVHDMDKIRMGTNDENTLSLGTKVLKGEYVLKVISTLKMDQAIIFCRTKQQCDQMERFLHAHGHKAVCLHGDRSPQERKESLESFRDRRVSFIICTDVAARGLDVSGIPFVINVTLPEEREVYVHRVGRVGRADRMGLSITLVSVNREKVWYHKCGTRSPVCSRLQDLSEGGCTKWYNEKRMLAEIEELIGQTIATVDSDFEIPVNEFDGRIVYGSKRTQGTVFEGHAPELAESVAHLANLEQSLQHSYLLSVQRQFCEMKVL